MFAFLFFFLEIEKEQEVGWVGRWKELEEGENNNVCKKKSLVAGKSHSKIPSDHLVFQICLEPTDSSNKNPY